MDMLSGPREIPDEEEEVEEAETTGDGPVGSVEAVFERMSDVFQADAAAGVDVVFQFTISGAGGGDWHTVIKDGTCVVEAGIHSKPTTTLEMSAEDFVKYVNGELPAMQAYTTGKLKIKGDLMKSQLIERIFKF